MVSREDRSAHLTQIAAKIATTLSKSDKDTRLVVLPELSSIDYSRAAFDHLHELAEPLDGESFRTFSRLARDHAVFIVYGMPRMEQDLYFITQVVIGPDGEYIGHYDKLHIAHFGVCVEKDYFQPGRNLLVFEVDGIRMAPIICYDFRFSALSKLLCRQYGVELILHSVAFYRDRSFHSWHSFATTRALENQVYLLSLNRAGDYYGSSIFCPPWMDQDRDPTVLSRHEDFHFFEIDKSIIAQARETYPLQTDELEDYHRLPVSIYPERRRQR